MVPQNKVQLITYPDSLGGNLKTLRRVMDGPLAAAAEGGIHILPPFPSSGDRGFAPLNYDEIDPRFGSWADLEALAKRHTLILDLMINHVSRRSVYARDYLLNGEESPWAEMFIDIGRAWPGGVLKEQDSEAMFLRREKPYSYYELGPSKRSVCLWTTFGKEDPSEQLDIDVWSEAACELFGKALRRFAAAGVAVVRLDAAAYIIKKPGSSCFFVEPEVFDFLDRLRSLADSLGLLLVPEVHARKDQQFELARKGYWIFDFILPFAILHALRRSTSAILISYLRERPVTQYTMLDCHDGIPVKPDLDGVFSSSACASIVDDCVRRGANLSRVLSPAFMDSDGFDVHQIRCSYYAALDCDDDAYIAARAIQFFVPGIPQIYYAGLLAEGNKADALVHSNDGRAVNRPDYTTEEIERAVQKPVVQRLLGLIRFRNSHAAFDGECVFFDGDPDAVRIRWSAGGAYCELRVRLSSRRTSIVHSDDLGNETVYAP
jgi:sucrose phosphorylase